MCFSVSIGQKKKVDTQEHCIYSHVTFCEKDDKLHEIYLPAHIGCLKEVKAPGKNLYTPDCNEIKIILLIFTGSQDFYLEVNYWQLGKILNHIFQVLTDLINPYVSEFE